MRVLHCDTVPVGEETENEAQEDDWMSAPLDCQEAKETKEKPANNLSSCYEDCAYGSQSRPVLPKPVVFKTLN